MNRLFQVVLSIVCMLLLAILAGGCPKAAPNVSYRNVKVAEVKWPAEPNFQNCWQDVSKRFTTTIFWQLQTATPGNAPHCTVEGTYMPVNDDPEMVLMAMIPLEGVPDGAPAMRLAISSLVEVRDEQMRPTAVLPQVYGNPPIECDLDAAQADWVRIHCVPQTLVDAMHDAARAKAWQPIDPSGAGRYPLPVNVDADAHFEKQTSK